MAEHTSATDVRDFVVPAPAQAEIRDFDCWAVVVGISKHAAPEIDLRYAARDAQSFSDVLRSPDAGGFRDERLHVLLDHEATTSGLTHAFRTVLKKPAREDLVVIYLACHAVPDPDRPDNLYIVTHDTRPDDISGTALPMLEVQNAIRRTLHARRVVLLADMCHSGAIGDRYGARAAADRTHVVNAFLRGVSDAGEGIAMLSAAEANEVAREDREHDKKWDGHGVFTHFLLRGLAGEADRSPRDGTVTVGELFDYVREQVPLATENLQHPAIGPARFDRDLTLAITASKLAIAELSLGRGLRHLAQRWDDDGVFAAAARHLAESVRMSERVGGASADVYVELALAHLATSQRSRTDTNAAGRLLAGDERDSGAARRLGGASHDDFSEALRTLAAAAAKTSDPAAADARFHLGLAFAKGGDRAQARELLEQFAASFPDDARAEWAGWAARELLARADGTSELDPVWLYEFAELRPAAEIAPAELARRHDLVVERCPPYPQLQLAFGRALQRTAAETLAAPLRDLVEELDRRLDGPAGSGEDLFHRGLARELLGERDAALDDLERASSSQDGKRLANVHYQYARALRDSGGNLHRARSELDIAIELAPGHKGAQRLGPLIDGALRAADRARERDAAPGREPGYVAEDSDDVLGSLGGSIVHEELKGCPSRAAARSGPALARARDAGDAAAVATALADHGLALLLWGFPSAAREHLLEAMRVGPPATALRAGLYERLASAARFNAFPDGQGAGAAEINARWNAIADESAAAGRLERLAQEAEGSPVLQLRRWTRILGLLPPIRNTLELMRTMPDPPARFVEMALAELLSLEGDDDRVPAAWTAYAQLAAADLCRRGGEQERGLALLDRARDTYGAAGDRTGVGACHLARGDWQAAPFSSPLSLNLALRESASEGSDLDWQVEEAEFSLAGADLDAARAAYDAAEEAFAGAGAGRGLAAVELRRGYLDVLADDHAAARRRCRTAMFAFLAEGDHVGFQLASIHAALAAIGAGALNEDRAAAAGAGGWGAGDGSFSLALGLGLLCGRAGRHWRLRRGDAERALACHRLAGSLYEALGARLNLAQSLVDQSDVLRWVGDAAGATVAYERAVAATAESSGAVARKRGLLLATEVAQLHHARQDADGMERAAAQLRERLEAFDPGSEPDGQAIATLAADQLSGLPAAIPLARAMALREAGRMEEAAPHFAEALAATRESTTEQRPLLEASVLGSQERYAEALEAYRRYAALRDGDAGTAATLARVLGPAQVARFRRQALEQNLAFFTRVKAWEGAREAANELEELGGAEWWQDDERPWAMLSDLGEVAEGLGELERALDRYEQAFDAYEARRGLLAGEGLRTALGASKDVQWLGVLSARCALRLADAGDPTGLLRAFALAERGKARVLLDLMARSAARSSGRLGEPPARRRWRELGARADVSAQLLSRHRATGAEEVSALEQRLRADQAALRDAEEELARSDPAWLGGMRATGEVAPLEEVAAAVPAGAALLQWVFLGHDLLAWAITRDGMVAHARRELDARALGRAIRELRTACESRAGDWERRAAELADPLLAPFAGVLADHERAIFVPYGVAHELPLHVLPFEGVPLAATHTVSTLPSASVLPHLRGGGARPWRVLAVGNPARMSHRPPGAARAAPAAPLRGAELEAELAAAAFPGGVALTGEAATEPAVRERLGEFSILHLATHGILDQEAPGMSAVLLADGEALSVYELAGLELDVDLAVLSACRTGQGETTRGDDVVGLARGLLGAGCRAAVVSLWPVDDASTTLLMAAFYRELQGGAGPADALRASALHVRGLSRADSAAELVELRPGVAEGARDILGLRSADAAAGYDHPYHWAPFALVGTGLTRRDTP